MIKEVIMLSVFLMLNSCSQRVYYNLGDIGTLERNEINNRGTLMAQEILNKDCREDPHPEEYIDGSLHPRKQFGMHELDSLTIIPIALFIVSSKGKEYVGSNLLNYLEWQEKDVTGFYTFKNGKFEGLLDWSGEHHHNLTRECYYFTVHNDNRAKIEPYRLGLKFLKERGRDTSFLFGVKYFVETLWFIEKEEVFVLDLREMKIYDPDEFVLNKCDAHFIQIIADGGQVICNY